MDASVKEDKRENGFWCEVCDCIVKDSLSYLDHVNGKRHNQNLGINVKKFTDSTLEEVKEMLEIKRRERDEQATDGYLMGETDEDFEERARQLKREKKKRQKARRAGLVLDKDDEDGRDEPKNDDDCDSGADEAENREELEDEMAKMMGFSSFSTSKK